MTAAVWSWADVPGLDAPPPARPAPRPAGAKRPHSWWVLLLLAEGEHAPAPDGATLRQAYSAAGPGIETVRGPVPASSRLVSPEAAS